MQKMFSYNQIVLSPSYSEIKSRKNLETSVDFLGYQFKSVAIPANMVCTIDVDAAKKLDDQGYFYILHRFYDYEEIYKFVRDNQDKMNVISISIGVQQEDKDLVLRFVREQVHVTFITIDVAHGHHILMKEMLTFLEDAYEDTIRPPRFIAGNIGTTEAVNDLVSWGADAVKVGIAMGKACTTYNCTGVGTPMFTTVQQCANSYKLIRAVPVIADGQIREVGDVCKALVAGANMVMIGSEFAKCSDSPSKTIEVLEDPTSGIYSKHKEFFGSASKFNKGKDTYVEGQKVLLPMREETYIEYLTRINEGVSSCMSYAGVDYINNLKTMNWSEIYPRN